jgi:hypothetical protein
MADPEGNLSWAVPETIAAPFRGAVKGGQAALGERPALSLPRDPDFSAATMFGATGIGRPTGAVADTASQLGRSAMDALLPPAKTMAEKTSLKATKMIEKRMNRVLPQTAQEAMDALNKARASGKPYFLPDAFPGGGVEKFAGRLTRAGGEPEDIIKRALHERNAGSVGRMTSDIDRAFGSEGAYDVRKVLAESKKALAGPAYEKAHAQPPVNPDVMAPEGPVGAMLGRPSVKRGMANARRIAAEEGVDLTTLGIDLDAQGEPVFVKVPTWKALDYIKRGIDDVVESYRDKTTGKLILDTYGRAAEETRRDYVRTLRGLNPEYGEALDIWSGPSQAQEAIQVGADAFARSPEQNAARIAEMTESDREFARVGVGQLLRDLANDKGPLAPQFGRIAGTQYGSTSIRQKIRPFFNTEADFQTFVDSVTAEVNMPRTGNRILGGSQTAERVAEDSPASLIADYTPAGIAAARGGGRCSG